MAILRAGNIHYLGAGREKEEKMTEVGGSSALCLSLSHDIFFIWTDKFLQGTLNIDAKETQNLS